MFDPWQVFAAGTHRCLQDTSNEDVLHTAKNNHVIDTKEAEEVTLIN